MTILLDILVTSKKPGLVLVDRGTTPTKVDLVELTVPWDSGAQGAKMRKEIRYSSFVYDIRDKGFQCVHTTLEIRARGLINICNKSPITWLCFLAREKKIKRVTSTLKKLAPLGSYSILVARRSQDWISGSLLQPRLLKLFTNVTTRLLYTLLVCVWSTGQQLSLLARLITWVLFSLTFLFY